YVANEGSNNVTPIATASNTAGTPIPVGSVPFGIAITPDGTTAYVANEGSNNVTPIATASNTPGTPITVGSSPPGIAITPDGSTASTTAPTTTHTYAAAGTFTVRVTETSSGGTSTTQVFTGQTMSRNGGPSATTSKAVTVAAATVPPVPPAGAGFPLSAGAV